MVTIGFPCAEESSQPCPRGLLGSCRCACARCCVCVGSRESVAFVSSLPSTGVSWLCVRAVWCGGGAFSAVRCVRIVRIASFAPRFFVFGTHVVSHYCGCGPPASPGAAAAGAAAPFLPAFATGR